MSDRVRVVLILVIVGLIAGGGGFYFFKVYRPAQDLEAAQEQVIGWEARFQGARDCLLGKSPGSSKTSEALAIREMAPDPWDRGKCTPLVSKLNRGEAPDTGLPGIEQAWGELDKSATKAAVAFARHVSESTTLEHDPLPAALDELDASRNKLRTIAKLPSTETGGKPLPPAQTLLIGDGTDRLTSLVVDTIPSAHGLILFGKTATRMVQVVLQPGAEPKAMRVGPASIRAVPDTTWGATPTATDVRTGTYDTEGVIATPTTLSLANPTIAAVSGTLAAGVVVYGNFNSLVIARAKAGVVTPDAPITITSATTAVDVDGRSAVVWDSNGTTHGQIFKPGSADEPVVELPALTRLCMTQDRVWGQNADNAVSFGAGRPVATRKIGYARLQGCTTDAALFHNHDKPEELVICRDDCRSTRIPSGAPKFATTTVVDGKLVAIASHGGVLGVWREGAQPTFYALPEDANPVLAHEWPAMALTDGKVLDVLARGESSFVVIRVPAI